MSKALVQRPAPDFEVSPDSDPAGSSSRGRDHLTRALYRELPRTPTTSLIAAILQATVVTDGFFEPCSLSQYKGKWLVLFCKL